MELWERGGNNLFKLLIQAGILWLIVSQIFVRLEERLPFFVAALATYVISAYVILPFLVQFWLLLTRQGRIPRFTKSRDGLTVDPVNLILLGTIDELEAAFKKIDWHKADKVNLKTSIKELRKSKRKEKINDRLRNRVKKATKKQAKLLKDGNLEESKKNIKNVYKVLDKAAKKNVIKKGKANRLKSKLTKNLNKLAQDNVKTAKKNS